MRTRTTVAALAFAVLALRAPVSAGDGPDWGARLKETGYDLVAAIDKGLKEAGSGVPFHAELELDAGTLVYSIDVAQGTRVVNVVLDPKTRKVVEKEVDEEDRSKEVAAAKVPLAVAIETATKGSGAAIEAILRLADGKLVVSVAVFRDGATSVVRVDGETGEVLASAPTPAEADRAYTDVFRVLPGEWASRGTNPWFVLEPGHVLVLEGAEDGQPVRLTVTVLDETKTVAGVETRVVEEREEEGGALKEVSRNYFAISRRTNDVYYFGEDVDVYRDGKVAGHPGAWLAGEKGARFGLMIPGTPLLGARWYQEVAPGVAMDRAEVVDLAHALDTPAGRFEGCLRIAETTPLEKGREHKVYAPGVGLVADADLRLARVVPAPRAGEAGRPK